MLVFEYSFMEFQPVFLCVLLNISSMELHNLFYVYFVFFKCCVIEHLWNFNLFIVSFLVCAAFAGRWACRLNEAFSSGQKAQAQGQNQGMLHWTEDRRWRHKKWWNWCQHITVRNCFAKDIVGEAKKAKELETDGETIPGPDCPEACPWFLKTRLDPQNPLTFSKFHQTSTGNTVVWMS